MDRIEDCISFLVGKAAQQVTRRARDLLAPFSVTPVQYAVLKVLSGADGLSGAEIAGRMILDSASVTGVVDRLEANGLVTRQPAPQDRRVHLIMLTSRAAELMSSLDAAMDRLNAEAASILGGPCADVRARLQQLGDQTQWQRHV